ncbi:MAG: M43 family zinc metalloprotease [Bacteroidota bacterium]
MKYILFSLSVFSFLNQFAQADQHCATDVIMKKYYASHPEIEAKKRMADLDRVKQHKNKRTNAASYVIPVVFHILHNGGPENISDAQVVDALYILNRDFAKKNGDTLYLIPEFKSLADSTKIQFALATKDPNGNCTNGIIHYSDPDTDWDDASSTLYQYTWDPTMYMNVYVVKSITLSSGFGAAGYTYFPGSLPTSSPADAIVLLNNYFGSIGTGNPFLSRVLTHEVGHWLGLYHVFGYTNGAGVDCSGDDFVSDTPPTQGYLSCPNASNPSSYQICTPGVSENYQNYMDYSYCVKMFTQEQGYVMQSTLVSGISGRDILVSNANLVNTGVISPNLACVPEADFRHNRSETCVGTPVTFADASTNGAATSYTWSFPGGTPAASNLSAPSITYNTPGVYSVTYQSGNSAGTSIPVTKTNIITVINNVATYSSPFTEGFETATIPNNDWDVFNSSGGSNWVQSFDAAYSGSFSAKLPSTNNTRLAVASMVSPAFNISATTSPQLMFRLATAESNPDHVNNLKVLASTDCENSWIQLYSKTGSNLVTTPSTTNPFLPVFLSEWRNEIINLSPVAGSTHVKFKFMYSRDTISGANNVFIDDINISSSTGLNVFASNIAYTIFPNPASETVSISFNETCDKVYITDVLGQVYEFAKRNGADTSYTFAVGENTKFKPGVYFITVESKGSSCTKKLIVN